MAEGKSKNKQKKHQKTNVIIGVLGSILAIIIAIVLIIAQPWKPNYLSGKYEQQFMDYVYDCMDFDELGDMSVNSVISEIYGSLTFIACTCSYIEYHNYYGDKALPKTEAFISFIPTKKKEIYDALSVFNDIFLETNIKSCIEREHNNWEAEYGDKFREKYGYSL